MPPLLESVVRIVRSFDVRRVIRRWPYLVLALVCSLLLCSSVFFFNGPKVDESEVVLNAVAIAAGNWSPEWPGYGHLAMYLPAAVLSALTLLLNVLGAAGSYADGIYLLFQNDAAYRITRLLYTLADVFTALIFARLIVEVTKQQVIAVLFFVYFLMSPDTWEYANFVRTDTLVSFFTAVAAYLLVRTRTRFTPVALGMAIGAAIACKYSAAVYGVLVALLLIQDKERPVALQKRFVSMVVAGVVALAAAWLFQPRYNFGGILEAAQGHLAGRRFVQEALPFSDRLVNLWKLMTKAEPLAALWLVAMLPALLHWRRSLPVLLLVVIGVAPFTLSHFPRDYWLLPFADALRAGGWLGIACLVQKLTNRSGIGVRWVLVGLAAMTLGMIALRLPALQHTRLDPHRTTNAEAARRWLYVNVANREPLVYVNEKHYLLPRAYSFRHYGTAKNFSRVFIFEREKFESLNVLFKRRFFTKEFADFSSMTTIRMLQLRATASDGKRVPTPQLCVGKQCFQPKLTPCDEAAKKAMGNCTNYAWNMDKVPLRQDLSRITLKLGPEVEYFAVCWYDCTAGMLNRKVNFKDRGDIALPRLAGRLFAPADVISLGKLRKDRRHAFIVTSPKAYDRWLKGTKLSERERKKPHEAFARLMGAKLVQRFDNGAGAVIEVYRR